MRPFRTLEISDPTLSPDGLSFVTVKSRALEQRADISFYMPPGLDREQHVPIVILLHGVFGSHWAWPFKGGAHLTAARLIAEGALPPVVLAMPSDGLWGDGSGYVPHIDQNFEAWIMEEVPAVAARICAGCTFLSPLLLAGLSMGGFAALRLAGKYPHRIAAAAAHSAVTAVSDLDDLIEESRSGWSKAAEDMNVLDALRRAPAPLPPLRFDCGLDDPFLANNRALHAALEEDRIDHVYREAEGGHDWAYWSREIEQSLRFFGTVLCREKLIGAK